MSDNLTDAELDAIEARWIDALPSPDEPTFGDEVWQIKHLADVVDAYRKDTPRLLRMVRELRAENERLQGLCDRLKQVGGKAKHEAAGLRAEVARLQTEPVTRERAEELERSLAAELRDAGMLPID